MIVHLDTSLLIRALVRGSPEDHRLREWLRAGAELAISAIGWAEFLCGPVEPGQAELAGRVVPVRVPFTEEEASLAAQLFERAGRRRGSLADCMIAATALRAGAPLATVHRVDFRRFEAEGLELVTP